MRSLGYIICKSDIDKLICELKEIGASVILNSISILIFCDLLHKSERISAYRKIIERKGIGKGDSSKKVRNKQRLKGP